MGSLIRELPIRTDEGPLAGVVQGDVISLHGLQTRPKSDGTNPQTLPQHAGASAVCMTSRFLFPETTVQTTDLAVGNKEWRFRINKGEVTEPKSCVLEFELTNDTAAIVNIAPLQAYFSTSEHANSAQFELAKRDAKLQHILHMVGTDREVLNAEERGTGTDPTNWEGPNLGIGETRTFFLRLPLVCSNAQAGIRPRTWKRRAFYEIRVKCGPTNIAQIVPATVPATFPATGINVTPASVKLRLENFERPKFQERQLDTIWMSNPFRTAFFESQKYTESVTLTRGGTTKFTADMEEGRHLGLVVVIQAAGTDEADPFSTYEYLGDDGVITLEMDGKNLFRGHRPTMKDWSYLTCGEGVGVLNADFQRAQVAGNAIYQNAHILPFGKHMTESFHTGELVTGSISATRFDIAITPGSAFIATGEFVVTVYFMKQQFYGFTPCDSGGQFVQPIEPHDHTPRG